VGPVTESDPIMLMSRGSRKTAPLRDGYGMIELSDINTPSFEFPYGNCGCESSTVKSSERVLPFCVARRPVSAARNFHITGQDGLLKNGAVQLVRPGDSISITPSGQLST
jgi:hypothetical protein